MRPTDRDSKESRFTSEGKRSDSQSADQYIDQVLQHDRVLLSGKHKRERSRSRAMGLLAASAMPAEGGLTSSVAKFFGAKGITGTLSVVLVAGGVTLSAVFLAKSSGDESPASRTVTGQTSDLPPTSPEVRAVPGSEVPSEPEKPATSLSDPLRGVTTQSVGKRGEPREGFEEMNEMETTEGLSSHGADPESAGGKGAPEPEVHHRNSARTTMNIDPVVIQKK